jgi:hypothetical protein
MLGTIERGEFIHKSHLMGSASNLMSGPLNQLQLAQIQGFASLIPELRDNPISDDRCSITNHPINIAYKAL